MLIFKNHIFNSNFNDLYVKNKGTRFNHLESLENHKLENSNLLLNEQIDLNNSPLVILFSLC